ncbi:MAG: type VI secretion system tip protein VgrG [Phaeodactylibacter sp.]|nr:type VI secretion system tip protein VgrG [Phaeodactylibacter sp.]
MRSDSKIPSPGSPGKVEFSLMINGQKLPDRLGLTSISVSQEANRIPTAKILAPDGNAAMQDFALSNEDWFLPGNDIEIYLGQLNAEALVFKGKIVKHQIRMQSGFSFLEIDCRHAAYQMAQRPRSRYYKNLTDSQLAEQIFKEHGFEATVEATKYVHPELVQYNCTDWDFLMMRMEANGLQTLLDNKIVKISKPDMDQEPVLRLVHGATLLEFEAELDVRAQFEEERSISWNNSTQGILEAKAREPKIKENGNLPGKKLAAVNKPEPQIYRHGGFMVEGELQAWADARLLRNRLSRTRGRVKFRGFAGIKPGNTVELAGFGNRFNGQVYVAGLRHDLHDGEWATDIEFGLSPKCFAQTFRVEAPPAAGLLAPVSGLQVGIVTQIENDPEGGYRIQARVPIIDSEAPGIWARVAKPDAGANRGAFFLPEPGDEVIIGFINDDPRDAIVLGMLHSRNKAAPFEATQENEEKGYVSREGLKVIFHEGEKSITLQTPGGNQMIISDEKEGLLLSDQHGNSIQMNADGISINSVKDIKVDAKMNMKTQTGSSWQTQSNGQASLKAASLNELKGAPVNIN